MNFDRRIADIEQQIVSAQTSIAALKSELASARAFTERFLDDCASTGINKVAIRKSHKSVPPSVGFTFGPHSSVFQPRNVRDSDGWPAIWGVVKRMGISGGCGNSDQHQIVDEPDRTLIDGVYHLRNGRWKRVDKED